MLDSISPVATPIVSILLRTKLALQWLFSTDDIGETCTTLQAIDRQLSSYFQTLLVVHTVSIGSTSRYSIPIAHAQIDKYFDHVKICFTTLFSLSRL
jgi:hypothetical protein